MFSIVCNQQILYKNSVENRIVNNFEQKAKSELLEPLLEPLFSNFPSVSHKYTLKLNLQWRTIFRTVLTELEHYKVIHSELQQSKVIHNVNENATVIPESTFDFVQWMKIISERKWKNFAIARKKVVK